MEGGRTRLLFGAGSDAGADICALLDEVRDAGETSWLFRPHLAEHPDAVSDGDRLSAVRVLAANTDVGPTILRALWRLGGRDDIVARLDLETGAVLAIFPAGSPHRAQAAPPGFGRAGMAGAAGHRHRWHAADEPVRPDRLGHRLHRQGAGDSRPRSRRRT
ncbi:MAG: hypothetical protein WDM85_02970 [Caulobacteraceae bacterium]